MCTLLWVKMCGSFVRIGLSLVCVLCSQKLCSRKAIRGSNNYNTKTKQQGKKMLRWMWQPPYTTSKTQSYSYNLSGDYITRSSGAPIDYTCGAVFWVLVLSFHYRALNFVSIVLLLKQVKIRFQEKEVRKILLKLKFHWIVVNYSRGEQRTLLLF